MPLTNSPDRLSVTARPTGGFGDEPPADRTERSPEEDDLALAETTRAYLACLAGGGVPGPALASAWDEFYRTYAPLVVRIVRRRCGRAGDPDDRAQDIWQAIVTRLVAFRPDPTRGPFRAWLLVVAHRRLTDRLRRDARKIRLMAWDEPPDHVEGAEEDPAVTCERDDERAIFAGLLDQLRTQVTPLSYRVLQLRALDGRAVSEVARLVGLTAAQVRARHHRTVVKLRRLAGAAEDHDPVRMRKFPENFRPPRNNGRPPDVSHGRGHLVRGPAASRGVASPPRLQHVRTSHLERPDAGTAREPHAHAPRELAP